MQNENDEFINAENDYLIALNKVNLYLLKQHTFNLEKSHFEEELKEVNELIQTFQRNKNDNLALTVEFQFAHLQKVIKLNKKQIYHLKSKLQQKQTMINELTLLNQTRKKYQKLIDTQYQNGIQQKLSMIRGKVDDLKKKIKEINKDILSYEQEHAQLIDQLSYEEKSLESYRQKNLKLKQQIQQIKNSKRK